MAIYNPTQIYMAISNPTQIYMAIYNPTQVYMAIHNPTQVHVYLCRVIYGHAHHLYCIFRGWNLHQRERCNRFSTTVVHIFLADFVGLV